MTRRLTISKGQIARFLLTALILALVIIAPAHAQAPEPPGPEHTAPHWQATYWNNRWLWGTPVVQRRESHLDQDWGFGSPHFKVQADRFSARWTRYIDVSAGTYRFTATSDDGVRVYVDGLLLIDQWHDQAPQTFTADVSLTAGHHLVKVEYYENLGGHLLIDQWRDQALSPHHGVIYLAGDVPIKMEYYEHGGVASAWLTWANLDRPPTPTVERIRFAPGAISAEVEGSLAALSTASCPSPRITLSPCGRRAKPAPITSWSSSSRRCKPTLTVSNWIAERKSLWKALA